MLRPAGASAAHRAREATMSDVEQLIRERAYLLWEQAGQPHGRGEEFWFIAQQQFYGGAVTGDGPEGVLLPPAEEPPEAAVQHGVPTGMPGERIAEAGVLDERLEELALPSLVDSDDD
jgi:Protein of unknown function (DUF2934)